MSLAIAGCSLAFDPSRYEHDDAAGFFDAGTDSGLDVTGPPGCDGTQPCCSWVDCESGGGGPYCAYDEASASWSCAVECAYDLDCAGYVAGDACLFGSGAGTCGCMDHDDCSSPGSPYCEPGASACVECILDADCPTDRTCVGNTCA
ncbi:MAG: hypothetical protein H6719_24505 [Sandaracinaceae bacterium]|nr:hypothetical protein [Sandaracinaceae bacterium]